MFLRLFFFLLVLPIGQYLTAQSVNLGGIINRYAAVSGYDSCSARITVSDTSGFPVGMQILLVHAQGVSINTDNNAQYGTISDIKQAGRIEKARVASRSLGSLFLEKRLQFPILPGTSTQVVNCPEFVNAVVTDTVFALKWDGQKGGVIALSVAGTLTLNAPISADKAGFRGGVAYLAPNNNCTWLVPETGYFYASGNWRGGVKGEGIAIGSANQELGRGAPANAGGGGNDHNAGGGGGSNGAAGGGGGDNDEPSAFGCDGYYPGLGGKTLAGYPNRLFMGGGGGSGHTNNTPNSDGGNGGGLIVLEANQVAGTSPMITASGENGTNAAGDGAGGGGAGGTIWIQASSATPNLLLLCKGGNGGNASGSGANRCFGPGGGGSAGAIFTNLLNPNVQLTGGSAGIVTNSSNACNGTSNDAQAGQTAVAKGIFQIETGNPLLQQPTFLSQPMATTICQGDTAHLTISLSTWNGPIQWQYRVGSNWVNIPNAMLTGLNVHPGQTTTYRCIVDGAACFQLISDTASVTVLENPIPELIVDMVNSNTVQFFNNSQFYNGQIWDFGDGNFSETENPQHSYSQNGQYEVTLTVFNGCDTVQIATEIIIELAPVAQFAGPESVTSCNPPLVVFQNESVGGMSYQWTFEGGQPATSTEANPAVLFNATGIYNVTLIVQNGAGADTSSRSIEVQLIPFPVADYTWQDLPDGTGVQFTFTGSDAILYSWDFGDGSSNSMEPNPVHIFPGAGAYPVRLQVQNTCGASVLELVVLVVDEQVIASEPRGRIMSVWPNPAHDYLIVGVPEETSSITLYGPDGRKKGGMEVATPGQVQIRLDGYPAGTYLLLLNSKTGYFWSKVVLH